ncbi:MAG: flagellar basal body L-ring protein FlgH [Gemmatimonadota bacterium]|nr:flagellar basal body L-ring protein FlgH [Gemmatimonadota bacterium]
MRTPSSVLSVLVAAAVVIAAPLHGQTPPPAGRGAAAPTTPNAAAPAVATTASAATTVLPAPRESWTSDRRRYAVGDIITVLIDDYTITTAVKENVASDTRSRGLGLTARLPGGASKGAGLDTKNDAMQNERGSAKRENRFQNEMSVRVVASGPNGLLQIKGTKKINVDKQMQDIELTGWLRAQDVSTQNTIESARIADAQIGYQSPGNLTKPKQGIISKILGALWP